MKLSMSIVIVLIFLGSSFSAQATEILPEDFNHEAVLQGILDEKEEISEEEWWDSFGLEEPYRDLYRGSETESELTDKDLEAAYTPEGDLQPVTEQENSEPESKLNKNLLLMEKLEDEIKEWTAQEDVYAYAKPVFVEDRDEEMLNQMYKEYRDKLEKEIISIDDHLELMNIWEHQYASVEIAPETLVE